MKYWFSLVILLLISCQKETEIDIPRSNPKITVACFLVPGKQIEVFIHESIHIYDNQSVPIITANVELYSGDYFIATIPHDSSGIYCKPNLVPTVGKSYTIIVNVSKFDKIIAHTNIPVPVSLDSIQLKRFVGTSKQGRSLSKLNIYFKDSLTKPGWYQYNCNVCTDSTNMFGSLCIGNWFSYHASILESGDKENDLFANNLYNENNKFLDLFYEEPEYMFLPGDTVIYSLSAQIYSLSEEMFRYSKSLKHYNKNADNVWQLNNPPTVYSNIKNGYGIFAGMSYSNVISRKIIDIKK